MFNDMFKRHPTTLEEPYYAVIKPGSLDTENYIIKDAIDSTLDLGKHWPLATLQELSTFLAALKNDLVLQGHVVELESIEYMYNNPGEGVVSTGLAWENVRLDFEFKNFVVSTVSSTLNDRDTRLDESATYDLISQSLQQLIAFSQELTDLSADDMPVLPSEEEYDEALSNNQDLIIRPSRLLGLNQINSNPTDEDQFVKSASGILSTHYDEKTTPQNVSIDANDGDEDDFFSFGNDSGASSNSGSNVPTAPEESPEIREEHPAETKPDITAQPQIPLQVPTDTTNSKLAHIQLVAPQFNLVGESMPTGLSAEAEDYVASKVYYDKMNANEFLQTTADQLLEASKLKLSQAINAENENFFERQQDILTGNDWQEEFVDQTRSKIHDEFMEQVSAETSSLEQSRDAKLQTEEERHQKEVASINATFEKDKHSLEAKLSNEEENATNEAITAGIVTIKADIDLQLAQLDKEHQSKIETMIETESYSLNQKNLATLSEIYQSLDGQLTDLESAYLKDHLQAVKEQTESVKATNKAFDNDKLERQLTQEKILSSQLQENLSQKANSSESFNRELTLKTTQLEQANAKISDLLDRISKFNDQSRHDELLTALSGNNKQGQPDQNSQVIKPHSFMKGALTSAGILLALSGLGYGAYHVQQVEAKSDTAITEAKAAKSSYDHKASKVVLSSSSSSEAKTSSSASDTENTTQTASSDYSTLDQNVAAGSLKVYYQSFYNKDLATEARVLSVGKLLIAAGNISDAKQLAQENSDHSSDLWMAIGQAQVGK